MKCAEFKEWFMDHDSSGQMERVAKAHLEECEDCKRLSEIDHRLDAVLSKSIVMEEVPDHLRAQLYLNLEQKTVKSKFPLVKVFQKYWAPAMAVAMMFIFMLYPFSPENINSLDAMSQFAIKDHQDNMEMAFKASDVSDVPAWFAKNTNLIIEMPKLPGSGYTLVGGRKCTLGACSAAYLLYTKNGRRISLFIIDIDDISASLEPGKKYKIETASNTVSVWNDDDQVYAMVI